MHSCKILLLLASVSRCKRSNALPSGFPSGWRNDGARPLVRVSALCFVQCFETVGWLSGRTSGRPLKILCCFSPKNPFWNKTQFHPDHGCQPRLTQPTAVKAGSNCTQYCHRVIQFWTFIWARKWDSISGSAQKVTYIFPDFVCSLYIGTMISFPPKNSYTNYRIWVLHWMFWSIDSVTILAAAPFCFGCCKGVWYVTVSFIAYMLLFWTTVCF